MYCTCMMALVEFGQNEDQAQAPQLEVSQDRPILKLNKLLY